MTGTSCSSTCSSEVYAQVLSLQSPPSSSSLYVPFNNPKAMASTFWASDKGTGLIFSICLNKALTSWDIKQGKEYLRFFLNLSPAFCLWLYLTMYHRMFICLYVFFICAIITEILLVCTSLPLTWVLLWLYLLCGLVLFNNIFISNGGQISSRAVVSMMLLWLNLRKIYLTKQYIVVDFIRWLIRNCAVPYQTVHKQGSQTVLKILVFHLLVTWL